MNDHNGRITVDVPHLQDNRGFVRPDNHGETVPQIPDAKRVSVGMKDVGFREAVLESRRRDYRLPMH
jgi:hypothetical protein